MAQDESHTEQGQIERAKRLRERIDRLRRGQPPPGAKGNKSLKEQIDERAREQREENEK